jgi:hypothetical protein
MRHDVKVRHHSNGAQHLDAQGLVRDEEPTLQRRTASDLSAQNRAQSAQSAHTRARAKQRTHTRAQKMCVCCFARAKQRTHTRARKTHTW